MLNNNKKTTWNASDNEKSIKRIYENFCSPEILRELIVIFSQTMASNRIHNNSTNTPKRLFQLIAYTK